VHSSPALNSVHLYLVGEQLIEVPAHDRIVALGRVSDSTKNWLISNAMALVMPSPYESLSLVLLESWHFTIPVIANGRCAVLKGQCLRSGGGLLYTDHHSFMAAAGALLSSPAQRYILGLRGLRYSQRLYAWPRIRQAYLRALAVAGDSSA
jgi:glycosyltransferase involved in cell wall biosynthesis